MWQDVRSFYEDPEPFEDDFVTLGDATPVARKHHTCDACEGTIEVGEKYRKFVGIHEGQFTIQKYHIGAGRCVEEENRVEEWYRHRDEITVDLMWETHTRDHAILCTTCDGWGIDLHQLVGDQCKVCGGAGQWDSGEDFPAAFEVETTEPRIPADLTNIYRPSPSKAPKPAAAPHVFGPDETPF